MVCHGLSDPGRPTTAWACSIAQDKLTVASEPAKAGNMHDPCRSSRGWSPDSWFWLKKASWGFRRHASIEVAAAWQVGGGG